MSQRSILESKIGATTSSAKAASYPIDTLASDGPPIFKNLLPEWKGASANELTMPELKNHSEEKTFLYVITPDKKLHISERHTDGHVVFHSDLARDMPVYAAGEINIKKKLLLFNNYYIDDCSGHYQPNGRHLKKLILKKFEEYGLSGPHVFFGAQCGRPYSLYWENLNTPELTSTALFYGTAIYNEIKGLAKSMIGDHCSEVSTKIYDVIRSQEATEFCATLLDAVNMSFGGVNFPAFPEADFNFESFLEYGKIVSESFVKLSQSHLAHMLHKSFKLINQLEQTIEYREDYEKNIEQGYSRTVAMIGASTGMIAKMGTQALSLAEIGGAEYAAISGIGLPAAGTLFIGGTYTLSKANDVRRIANEISIQTAQFIADTITSPSMTSDTEELPDLTPAKETTESANQEEKASSQIDLSKKFYALSAMKLVPTEPDLLSAEAETTKSKSMADISVPEFKITRFEEPVLKPTVGSHNVHFEPVPRFDSGGTVERIGALVVAAATYVSREIESRSISSPAAVSSHSMFSSGRSFAGVKAGKQTNSAIPRIEITTPGGIVGVHDHALARKYENLGYKCNPETGTCVHRCLVNKL